MTYLNYLSYGYYQLRWPFIFGFVLFAITRLLFADHIENTMIIFSILCSCYLGYKYTENAPKYRYISNIVLSFLVFSSLALFVHIMMNLGHLTEIWTWAYFYEFRYRIAASILLTQLGVILYFLHMLWIKLKVN